MKLDTQEQLEECLESILQRLTILEGRMHDVQYRSDVHVTRLKCFKDDLDALDTFVKHKVYPRTGRPKKIATPSMVAEAASP